jgi:CHAD domain-containing protein
VAAADAAFEHIEVEAKLAADDDLLLPDLVDVVPGLRTAPPSEQVLDAVYHDTTDLRLARHGITMRHRTSDTRSAEGTWTVKFPDAGPSPVSDAVLRRRELNVPGPPGEPPDRLTSLVRGASRSAPLVAVAHLRTRRRTTALRVGEDLVGEVCDDVVTRLDGDRVVAAFREIEVEVAASGADPGGDGVIAAVVGRLRQAGARSADPLPKVVQALGPEASAAPDVVAPRVDGEATVGELVRHAIASSVIRILDHDHVVRLDDDPEGVHQARVGARRLRSDLRTFAPALDEDWCASLRTELGWLGAELGAVRDLDVLAQRLHRRADHLPTEADRMAAAHLLVRLDQERGDAVEALLHALDSARYVTLLDHVVEAANRPVLAEDAGGRAASVVPGYVRRPWRRFRQAASDLAPDAAPTDFHRVRILAKRARYAAEATVPVLGGSARKLARRLAEVQDLLGDHQDAAVAEVWLRQAATDRPGREALAAGLLVAAERDHAAELRAAWPSAWARVKRAEPGWLR